MEYSVAIIIPALNEAAAIGTVIQQITWPERRQVIVVDNGSTDATATNARNEADLSRAATIGYRPSVDLASGIGRYLDWIRTQGDVREYFAAAEQMLRSKRIVQPVKASCANS